MSNPFSCSFVAIANPNPREQPETMANGLAAAAVAADADDSDADKVRYVYLLLCCLPGALATCARPGGPRVSASFSFSFPCPFDM